MGDIVEVIHDLSYKVTGAENIKQVGESIEKNAQGIDKLKAKLSTLQDAFKTTQNVNEQQRLSNQILKTKRAIDDMSTSATKQVQTSKVFQQTVVQEIGIIQKLNDKLTDFKRIRDAATSTDSIHQMNDAIRETQAELSKLTEIQKEGGGLGALLGIGSSTGTGKQILQGALSGLGIGVGFSVIPALTASLTELVKLELSATKKSEELQKANEDLTASFIKLGDAVAKYADEQRLIDILLANSFDQTTDGVKRREEAVKALGIVNGQVFRDEKTLFEASQETRESELQDVERLTGVYKQFQNTIKDLRLIGGTVDESILNRILPDKERLKIAKDLNAEISKTTIPDEEKTRIRNQIKEAADGRVLFNEVLAKIDREYDVKLSKQEQERLNKVAEIENAQVEYHAKIAEKIRLLDISLLMEVNSARDKFAEEEIARQEKTTDNVEEAINIRARAATFALNKEYETAQKQGIVTEEIEKKFNERFKILVADFDAQKLEAKRQFYIQQLQLQTQFNTQQLSGELAASKQRLSELSVNELTPNLELRKEIIDKELQIQLSGISQEFTNQTQSLEKLQVERRAAGQTETQEYKLTQDQLSAIYQASANQQEDAIRTSNIRKLNTYAEYYQKVLALTELNRQQLSTALNAETSQERLDIEEGRGGLFGRSFQRKLQGYSEEIRQAEIDRNAALQDLDIARDRLRKAQEQAQGLSGDTAKAAQLEIDAAGAAVNALDTKVNTAQTKQIQAARNARIAEVNAYIDSYQAITTAAVSFYNQTNELRQQDLQREINAREQRVNVALQLAERGNTEVLNLEQKRLEAAQNAYRKNALEQQSINAGLALSNAIVGVTKAAAEGGVLAPATIATFMAALAAGLVTVRSVNKASQNTEFWKGGYTGDGGKFDEAGTVHKGEFVIDKETTSKFRPILEHMHETGQFPVVAPYKYHSTTTGFGSTRQLENKLDTMIDRMDNLEINQYIGQDGIHQSVKQSARRLERRYLD